MTDQQPNTPLQETAFDSWRSISISLYMALVGYSVLVGIPVISTAWVNLLGFTEVEVGRVAGADLGGLSLGALFTAAVIAKLNRRHLVIGSAIIAMAANGLCTISVDYDQVLWLRLMAGFGSGVFTAVSIATLGASSKPARSFNMLLFFFAFTQALEIYFLPKLSMSGIYTAFIVATLIGLPLVSWFPPRPESANKVLDPDLATTDNQPLHVPAYVPWLCLGAIVATYINIGTYWTYIQLATIDTPADPDIVANVLWAASFFSVVACLFATFVSNRFGLARPLLITLVVQAAVVAMLATGITDLKIIVSVFMFNFLWIFIDVYQMSTIANVDKSGRFAALIPGAQGLGQIIGPNIAATILGMGLGYDAVFIMCACAVLTGMLIYLYIYIELRKVIPALADAG